MSYTPPSIQRFTPTTGQTVTPANSNANIVMIIKPAGLLAALTIAFPSAPFDGQRIIATATQIITILTLSGGTIINPLTSLALNGYFSFIYIAADNAWYRIG
jgi:hypothetical protein